MPLRQRFQSFSYFVDKDTFHFSNEFHQQDTPKLRHHTIMAVDDADPSNAYHKMENSYELS